MSFTSTGNGKAPSGTSFLSTLSGGLPAGASTLVDAASMLGNVPGAGLIGGAARAAQLAQTGMSLLGRSPASIADAINGMPGAKSRLTQDSRFVRMESPLGPDALLVNALVVDEYVSRLPEIHLDLLSHQSDIEIDKIVGQQVSVSLEPKSTGAYSASWRRGRRLASATFRATLHRSGASGTPARSRATR